VVKGSETQKDPLQGGRALGSRQDMRKAEGGALIQVILFIIKHSPLPISSGLYRFLKESTAYCKIRKKEKQRIKVLPLVPSS
jgi:hypothetical protein